MRRNIFSRRRPSTVAGFTILELLVVIFVLATLVAIFWPLTVRLMVRLRIEGYADQLGMMIQRTRAQAVRENKLYAISWDGDTIVPSGPWLEIEDWTLAKDWEADDTGIGVNTAARLAAGEHGLSRYAGAACLDHDGDGNDDTVTPPLIFDGLGAPMVVNAGGRLESGLVAFCFADPPRASSGKSNVMQVRIDSAAGVVKVAKLIEDSGVSSGIRFADEVERFEWEWY